MFLAIQEECRGAEGKQLAELMRPTPVEGRSPPESVTNAEPTGSGESVTAMIGGSGAGLLGVLPRGPINSFPVPVFCDYFYYLFLIIPCALYLPTKKS